MTVHSIITHKWEFQTGVFHDHQHTNLVGLCMLTIFYLIICQASKVDTYKKCDRYFYFASAWEALCTIWSMNQKPWLHSWGAWFDASSPAELAVLAFHQIVMLHTLIWKLSMPWRNRICKRVGQMKVHLLRNIILNPYKGYKLLIRNWGWWVEYTSSLFTLQQFYLKSLLWVIF